MIRAAARRLALVLSAGYILMFFSEHLFWARFRPGIDGPGNYLNTYIAYCLAGYAALAVISIFRVRRAAAVFLAGAVFGWLTEGVIVGTAYEMLPLSISFTGLAWHAPISVALGLWAVPEILSRRRAFLLPAAAGIGLFFGAWGINWLANESEYHATVPEFILFATVATGALIVAYGVFLSARRSPARIHPPEGIALGGLAAFFFLFRGIEQPVAFCVLPILMGLTFCALWINRRKEAQGSLLAEPLAHTRLPVLAALLLIPTAAAAVYAPAVWLGAKIQTNILFYLLLTPLGFFLYGASLAAALRSGHAAAPETRPEPRT
ncbi:MAG: hypothetical protein JW929_11315 [Anaerolineales bacterium]|nr:hypothetical protein [Anaerolineales bacterium]